MTASIRQALSTSPRFVPAIPAGATDPTRWTFAAPEAIPRREWLYDRLLCRKYLTLTIAPGGVGKSSLSLVESLAMVTHRPLLTPVAADRPLTVWEINLEDSIDECNRRLAAACLHYGLAEKDVGGRLYLNSGLDSPVKLAHLSSPGKAIVDEAVFCYLKERIVEAKIDVLKIDPFISAHDLPENDNPMIDRVAKRLARLAYDCDIAIALTHHTKKSGNGRYEHDAESSRGASALVNAARVVRVLNRLSKKEAVANGISGIESRSYVQAINDKQNLAPAVSAVRGFQIISVGLGNGTPPWQSDEDQVGVMTSWRPTAAKLDIDEQIVDQVRSLIRTGNYAAHPAAADWAGNVVAPLLGLTTKTKREKKLVADQIKSWIADKLLERRTEDCPHSRKPRPFIRLPDAAIKDDDDDFA